jgi:uncharacterized membrane protein YkvA (DUF1232 family)
VEPATRFLDAFPQWLRSLGPDVRALSTALAELPATEPAARTLAGALSYLFRSLDLIQDGIWELGYMDDAFVLRVAARKLESQLPALSSHEVIGRLAQESVLVEAFLEQDYSRLDAYVDGLGATVARGRTVDAIVTEAEERQAFVDELLAWAQSFEAPSFSRDEKNLVKLRAFLNARLPPG